MLAKKHLFPRSCSAHLVWQCMVIGFTCIRCSNPNFVSNSKMEVGISEFIQYSDIYRLFCNFIFFLFWRVKNEAWVCIFVRSPVLVTAVEGYSDVYIDYCHWVQVSLFLLLPLKSNQVIMCILTFVPLQMQWKKISLDFIS
jgi:hypothetical protein